MIDTLTISTSSSVALLQCPDYQPETLKSALETAADIACFPDIRGARILVKPNLLNASSPDKAVTTHPEFLRAVLVFLKARGASSIAVGDSPAWQGSLSAARQAGMYAVAQEEGARWVDFQATVSHPAPMARLVKNFMLSEAVSDCDLIINLPKLKTHRLMHYTGAIKNLFGLVPGFAKSGFHLRFPDTKAFGTMLVDLALSLPACFTFMDGVVAMEGEGPGNGTAYPLGLLLASKDLAALDWVGAQCIGYEPSRIPYLVDAMERNRHEIDEKGTITTAPGNIDSLKARKFALIPYTSGISSTIEALPQIIRPFIRKFAIDRPIFSASSCIGCLACVKICPVQALDLEKGAKNRVRIDDKACITCFCCHEVCPASAIHIGKVLRRPFRSRKPR